MNDYPIDDYNEESGIGDDSEWDDDPNRCPLCGDDITVNDDWCFCTNYFECGWSEYLGDEEMEGEE